MQTFNYKNNNYRMADIKPKAIELFIASSIGFQIYRIYAEKQNVSN